MPLHKVPFEILRRNDGRVALSVNAGLLTFEPERVQPIHNGLVIRARAQRQSALICCQDPDVWACLQKNKSLRLYEFSSMGFFAGHLLRMVETADDELAQSTEIAETFSALN